MSTFQSQHCFLGCKLMVNIKKSSRKWALKTRILSDHVKFLQPIHLFPTMPKRAVHFIQVYLLPLPSRTRISMGLRLARSVNLLKIKSNQKHIFLWIQVNFQSRTILLLVSWKNYWNPIIRKNWVLKNQLKKLQQLELLLDNNLKTQVCSLKKRRNLLIVEEALD